MNEPYQFCARSGHHRKSRIKLDATAHRGMALNGFVRRQRRSLFTETRFLHLVNLPNQNLAILRAANHVFRIRRPGEFFPAYPSRRDHTRFASALPSFQSYMSNESEQRNAIERVYNVMHIASRANKEEFSVRGKREGRHDRKAGREGDFLEGFVFDLDMEEGFFVEVFGVVEVDPLVDIHPDGKYYAVCVIGGEGSSRKVQLALQHRMRTVTQRWGRYQHAL